LAEANLVPSVGCVGNAYGSALAATINGLYNAEVLWRQRSWPPASTIEMATRRWVDWFNNDRLYGPIGHIPPAEAEAKTMLPNRTSIWSRGSNQTVADNPGAVHRAKAALFAPLPALRPPATNQPTNS
jgi:hypothetical protein